ncbi:MAG: transcription factor S-II central domain-containing protein [Abditibacteriales bacterium]|nr:transcription factor S-II central domain-containing protein [Abditibacteriales bacterium]MDW8364233.1 hypothetical protein [Abditibacteriales bacterium]
MALTIDAVARCNRNQRKRLAVGTPFNFFTKHNLIEFKSPHDRLTVAEFHRILARSHLYAAQHGVKNLSDILVCIICVTRPTWLLNGKPPMVTFTRKAAAVYLSDSGTVIPCYIMVTNELPVEPINYPLLVFTTGQKRKEFIQALVADGDPELLTFAYLLYEDDVKEGFAMAKKPLPEEELMERIRSLARDYGVERFLSGLTPAERLAGMKPEERLAGMKPEERLAGMKPEELAQLREAIDRLLPNGKTNGKKKRRKR